MAKLKKLFEGVYKLNNHLITKNLARGKKVYGEELVKVEGTEYRIWDPFRSKLAAAIEKGLKECPIKKGDKILYLGSAEGTTISHLGDIIGERGVIFGVDISARVMRKFLYLCESRQNMVPILADAKQPITYKEHLQNLKVDLLYQDVSQKRQAEIFRKNSRMYLKSGGYGFLAIKARSISSTEDANKIIEKEAEKLKKEFAILQLIKLQPFDREHAIVYCKKK